MVFLPHIAPLWGVGNGGRHGRGVAHPNAGCGRRIGPGRTRHSVAQNDSDCMRKGWVTLKKRALSFVSLALAMVMVWAFTACAGASAGSGSAQGGQSQSGGASVAPSAAFPGTADAGTVVLDITSEPYSLSPLLLSEAVAIDILRHVMSGLTKLDANDQPVPDLAERWENNEDNTMTTFYLRKDAKWSNGDPVTSKDFYFSWVTQMNPETGSALASFLYEKIKNGMEFYEGTVAAEELGIQVVDDYTLQVEWAMPMPNAAFWATLPPYFPLNQKAYEEIGAEAYALDADKMVTNGAYQMTEWVHDDHILMEKVEDHYAAATVAVPTIKLTMIGDDNTRLNALMAGELDVGNLYGEQIATAKGLDEKAVHAYIDGGAWYLNFNTENEFLANTSLRKALSYAVDVQSLLDNVIKDGSVAANGLVPDVIAGVDGTSYAQARGGLFAYDPEAAKTHLDKALEELGVTAADIGLELMANDSTYSQNQAAYLQQQWKETLGLDVGIRVLPAKASSEARNSGDFDMVVTGWGPNENDPITFLEIFVTGYPNNYGRYSNAEYDALLAAARQESDPAVRQQQLVDAESILLEDMAIGPLYFTTTTYGASSKVQGLVRSPFQLFSFLDGASVAA